MSPRGERALVPDAEFRSYYERPILKEPVWRWEVAAYFFTGGLAAGSSLLAAGADLAGSATLARRARLAAVAGVGAGTGFLVADLGRRERLHHMLRVAKPTSPMSIGSWILAGFAPAAAVAAVSDVFGAAPRLGRAGGLAAAGLAPLLASYTAVLVCDTAIPAWHDSYRELPFAFVGGAAASAGACAVITNPAAAARPGRRLLLLGAALELAATRRMEQALPDPVGAPYRTGRAGRRSRAATRLTAAGAGLVAIGGRRRAWSVLGGALVLGGAALERLAVLDAGRESARDPRAVVAPQRARAASQ
jgi:hypothetical protein